MLGNRRMNVAIDMHLIPRWDRKHGAELVRSKAKRGTHLFERYITVQCVTRRIQLTLGAFPMPALTDTADFVRKTIDSCLEKKVRIGIAMLDREFFSTDVIRAIDGMGIKYLIPCINTTNVTRAIGEFACGRRLATSKFRIAKSKHDYAEYTMIITKRKRKRKTGKPEKPEEKYIAFATNMPGDQRRLLCPEVDDRDRLQDDRKAKGKNPQQKRDGPGALLPVHPDPVQHVGNRKRQTDLGFAEI